MRERITPRSINFVRFIGEDIDGTRITLTPKNKNDVMYSFVVDTTLKHPTTGQSFQEGDVVENNVKWISSESAVTNRDTIRKAGNGQLRIQSKLPFPCIWNFFEFEKNVTLALDRNFPDTVTLPDLENFKNYMSVTAVTSAGQKIPISRGSVAGNYRHDFRVFNFDWTIYTKDPITSIETKVDNSYFAGQWTSTRTKNGNNQRITAFDEQLLNQINNPVTKYDLKVLCASNDSAVIRPTASAYSNLSGDLKGRANIRLTDGKWATRGFKVGDSLAFRFSYKNWTFDTTYVIEFLDNRIEFVDENNVDVCDF